MDRLTEDDLAHHVRVNNRGGDDDSFNRARVGTKRVTEPSPASEHCMGPDAEAQAKAELRAPRAERVMTTQYKLLRGSAPSRISIQFTSLFMTVTTSIPMSRHLHPSNTSHADPYHSLDRALAAKYVQLVLAHRRRVAAAAGGTMRPRCVLSFSVSQFSLTFVPAWKYAINLNPASSLPRLKFQVSRKRR
jgi:hypothetical protein